MEHGTDTSTTPNATADPPTGIRRESPLQEIQKAHQAVLKAMDDQPRSLQYFQRITGFSTKLIQHTITILERMDRVERVRVERVAYWKLKQKAQ